ncbi:MAG: hypothetical protein AB8B83_03255 [Bdellovibrionales bacterium]
MKKDINLSLADGDSLYIQNATTPEALRAWLQDEKKFWSDIFPVNYREF